MDAALAQAIVGLVMAIVSLVASAAKAFKFVQEGERGVKLRFGKFVRVVDPGFVLLIPWVETLPRLHVRDRPRDVPTQVITLKDKLSFEVSAVIVFRISDSYQAMFGVDAIDDGMTMSAASILREHLAELDYEKASDFESLRETLENNLQNRTAKWGVDVSEFSVMDFAPTSETAAVIISIAEAEKLVEGNKIVIESMKEASSSLSPSLNGEGVSGLLSALILRRSGQPLVSTQNAQRKQLLE